MLLCTSWRVGIPIERDEDGHYTVATMIIHCLHRVHSPAPTGSEQRHDSARFTGEGKGHAIPIRRIIRRGHTTRDPIARRSCTSIYIRGVYESSRQVAAGGGGGGGRHVARMRAHRGAAAVASWCGRSQVWLVDNRGLSVTWKHECTSMRWSSRAASLFGQSRVAYIRRAPVRTFFMVHCSSPGKLRMQYILASSACRPVNTKGKTTAQPTY